MSAAGSELNPTGQRFYLYTQQIISGNVTQSATRIYLNHTPQIETGQIVGIAATSKISGPGVGQPGNISQLFYNGTTNVGAFTYLDQLFLTLVNKNDETIFQNIPYSTLYPFNGKIHKYNAVNIDTRKSYFSFASGVIITGDISANLIFVMNYQ
jgi:hypothetical protein